MLNVVIRDPTEHIGEPFLRIYAIESTGGKKGIIKGCIACPGGLFVSISEDGWDEVIRDGHVLQRPAEKRREPSDKIREVEGQIDPRLRHSDF